ncbi:MAG: serine/threonine protein kinase [Lentisphaerae bacterium]|nr:serine/threonine protein kinase [Lentisphaerota bacterium]
MTDPAVQAIELDGYDQAQKIGRGGMASVWKARQISLDRWVAVKVLFPEHCTNDEEIDRFQSEARVAARMNHPGIVQVYDAFYRKDRFCFVMEYVDGYTIGSWIKTTGFIEENKCLFVAEGVAKALAYAWNKQLLVHCDIKPENIMVDSSDTVKVTDFGLSRSIVSLQTRRRNDEVDFIFGTPAYISPEQAMGESDLAIHTDMYSLGATLFHMATGKKLFEHLQGDAMMEAQVHLQYTDPYELNPGLSPFFCDFLEKLLAKGPEDRYDTWESVISDIESLQNGLPIGALSKNYVSQHSSIARTEARNRARENLLKRMINAGICDAKGTPPNPQPQSIISEIVSEIQENSSISKQFEINQQKKRRLRIKKNYLLISSAILLGCLFLLLGCFYSYKKSEKFQEDIRNEIVDIEHFFRVHPHEYRSSIRKYDLLLAKLPGKKHIELKRELVDKRKIAVESLERRKREIMQDLRHSTAKLIEEKQFLRAASIIQMYDGELADETRTARENLSRAYREQASRSVSIERRN